MKYFNIIIFSFFIFSACETETSNTDSNDQTDNVVTDTLTDVTDTINDQTANDQITIAKTETENKEMNWLCILNQKVGLINADSDEEAIFEIYGKENVIREEVDIGEGEMTAATIIFPNTPNELIVEWEYEYEYIKLSRIRIERKNAEWVTEVRNKNRNNFGRVNGNQWQGFLFLWLWLGLSRDNKRVGRRKYKSPIDCLFKHKKTGRSS